MLQCSVKFYVEGSYRTIKQFFHLTGFIPTSGENGCFTMLSGAVAAREGGLKSRIRGSLADRPKSPFLGRMTKPVR